LKNQKRNNRNNYLWYIVVFIVTVFLVMSSCAPQYVLRNRYDSYYTQEQVDSLCDVEGLPKDFTKKWNTSFLVDENRSLIRQHIYLTKPDTAVYVLTLKDSDSLYRFKKRVKIKLDK
jgi:hypothetical protein